MTPLKLAEIEAERRYQHLKYPTGEYEFDFNQVVEFQRAAFIAGDQRDRWISVKDELPNDKPRVLALFQGENTQIMVVASYIGSYWYSRGEEISNVTHWQELPSPPSNP
jgi:hypothetical protein